MTTKGYAGLAGVRGVRWLAAAVAGAALLAGCSTGGGEVSSGSTTATTAPSTTGSTATTPTTAPGTSTTTAPDGSATAAPDLAALFRRVRDGVIRVETTACDDDGGGTGSGLLVAPDRVLTVAHVVEGAATIALRGGDEVRTGRLLGIDPGKELALIKADRPFSGHVFTLDPSLPDVGEEVVALGYPAGLPLSLARGTISGLDREIDFGDGPITGLIQTDAPTNPGNSGGPLVRTDGTVVGLVEGGLSEAEGLNLAVPASTARPAVAAWSSGTPSTGTSCDEPVRPDDVPVEVVDVSNSDEGPAMVRTFVPYVRGINTGDYETAFAQLSAARRSRYGALEEFARGVSTSYIFEFHLTGVRSIDATTAEATATFTSVQDEEFGPQGQPCSQWNLEYRMVDENGWRIDDVKAVDGSPWPCED